MKKVWRNTNISLKVNTRLYIRSAGPIDPSVQCRTVAIISNTDEKTWCCAPQMAKKYIGYLMEGQGNRTTKHGQLSQRKKTALAGSRSADGPPTDTTTGTILGGYRFQDRTRSTKS